MLRLTCSLEPSLTHTHSAFSAEGLGAKLQSGQFFLATMECAMHILLVSLITWNMNSENSENSEFQLELRVFFFRGHLMHKNTKSLAFGKMLQWQFSDCKACPEQLACYFSTEPASGLVANLPLA